MTLRYLEIYTVRGLRVAYYRRAGRRVRLYGTDAKPVDPRDVQAVAAAWQRAHDAHEAADAAAAGKNTPPPARSIAALIVAFRASPEWAEYQPETRRDYEKALAPLETDWGKLAVAGLRRHHIPKIRDRYAWRTVGAERISNARQANRVVTVLSVLLTYASRNLGWREDNPALQPKRLRTNGPGYRAWTEAEFVQFFERASDEWRVAAVLALTTNQRGQDQVKMAWSDYDGTALRVAQLKGRKTVRLWLPCVPLLKAMLDDQLTSRAEATVQPLTILHRPDGRPWAVNAFQKAAGAAVRAAGLEGCVWHGLRTTGLTWTAEGGATPKQQQALSGHLTLQSLERYNRGADQRRLVEGAVAAMSLPAAVEDLWKRRAG